MDIFKTKPGDSIRLHPLTAGLRHHKERVASCLTLGKTYTVKKIVVGGWHTDVYLEGFEKPFNSVFFENVEGE